MLPMTHLTTRELAVLSWGAAFFAWALSNGPVRESAWAVVATAFTRPILTFLVFLSIWTTAATLVLHQIGLWTPLQLKETVLWLAFTGLASGIDAATGYAEPNYWKAVRDGLGVMVIVQFLTDATTFPFLVEILLVFFLTTASLMVGVAEATNKNPEVKRFLEGFLGIAGAFILAAAVWGAWEDFSALANFDAVRSLLLPPILSACFIPAMFILAVQARYEWLFGKLRGTRSYRSYARFRLTLLLGPRPDRVLAFGRRHAFDLPHVRSRKELEALIKTSGKLEEPNDSGPTEFVAQREV